MGIHWSPPRQYDDKGDTPSVGANDKFAVEVHTVGARGVSDDQIVIACRLGVFDSEHPRQLTWEPQVALGYGIEPKIAVAPDGTIIVISGDRYVAGQMTYRPGRIDAQTKRIVWGAPHRTDYADNGLGVPGGIALTNDRKFVAVFRGSNRQLRYQTGRIDGGVAYLGSVWPYDKGLTPSICLAENVALSRCTNRKTRRLYGCGTVSSTGRRSISLNRSPANTILGWSLW
jgi:hypothetical protein